MARRASVRIAVALGAVLAALALGLAGLPVISLLARGLLATAAAVLVLWLAWRTYQAFTWKVGRRLAFSYFLIGVVPIPMVLLLGLATAYLLASFFLGHLYRDAMRGFQDELVVRADEALAAYALRGRPGLPTDGALALDYYRQGRWVGGAGAAPEAWPAWLTEAPEGGEETEVARYVARGDGAPTLAVAVERGELGVTAVYTGDLAAALRRESGLWVELVRPDAGGVEPAEVALGSREVTVRPLGAERLLAASAEERQQFFAAAEGDPFWDSPVVSWVQQSPPLRALGDGEPVAPHVVALLNSTPRALVAQLFSASSELDAVAWLSLIGVSMVLLGLYAVAVLVALAMIFGLSRAVNRLSRATAALQQGDFSVRIPVRRRDQVGALQRSFNDMAEGLETSVQTAAQKEILEKELALARELQESLLPSNLPQGEAVEFATLFEPSAAIGGDYFDILRLDEDRLAVVIADVSGHGLGSGLRMAMLKAALQILIDQTPDPKALLRRLDGLIRAGADQHYFVTATLALVDLRRGRLELTNAGHPPTYLVRRGGVEEILLPGSPLGYLGQEYGSAEIALEADDVVVWLSDGLIEGADPRGEPFGYERIVEALSGRPASAVEVRSGLLAAIESHVAGRPADDDRTLVVMHYRAPVGRGGPTGGDEEATRPLETVATDAAR